MSTTKIEAPLTDQEMNRLFGVPFHAAARNGKRQCPECGVWVQGSENKTAKSWVGGIYSDHMTTNHPNVVRQVNRIKPRFVK